MDGIKHSGRFAEMERLVNDYFNCHIAPIMSKTRTDLIRNPGENTRDLSPKQAPAGRDGQRKRNTSRRRKV